MAIYKIYTKEIFKNLNYRPTWLPGVPMKLGTVGVIENGAFRPITSLENLNIPYDVILDAKQDTLDYNSSTGVMITFKGAGETNEKFEAIGKASAGVLIEFSRRGAIVMQLKGVANHRIADQVSLNKELLRSVVLGNTDQWQRDWVVITEVVQAETGTIVISNTENSKLELQASGSVKPVNLVDASANLSVAKESQVSTKIIAESGLTPLFRGVRVKRKFLWLFNEVQQASTETPEINEVFGEADPEEDEL